MYKRILRWLYLVLMILMRRYFDTGDFLSLQKTECRHLMQKIMKTDVLQYYYTYGVN